MKKILLTLTLLFLSGCSYQELNELAIIKNIGIEVKDNNYILYSQLITSVDRENNPETKIIKTSGQNIEECFLNLLELSSKTLHYSHIDLLILDKSLNKEELNDIFNFFLTNKDFRNDFNVISSDDITPLLENSGFDEIKDLLENGRNNKIKVIDIENVIKKYIDNSSFEISSFTYQNDLIEFKNNIVLPKGDENDKEKN